MGTTKDWAEETFGGANLGDRRRTRRLVELGRSFAERPAGRVTEVLREPAAREAAFRFLENPAIDVAEIARAVHESAARRCADDVVVVPVDQSSLSLTDRTGRKGFGRTGVARAGENWHQVGLHVMTALAVDRNGVAQGIVGQAWWNRQAKTPHGKGDRRPIEQRESSLWTRVIAQAVDVLRSEAPGTTPWFQLDRGGDAAHVLRLAADAKLLLTVRSTHDRALADRSHLRRQVAQRRVCGRYQIAVPARRGRPARVATLSVRFAAVRLRLIDQCTRREHIVAVNVIEAKEVSRGLDTRIDWRLLTTAPVSSFEAALGVIDAYTKRWRVEDLHRAWKSGACNIERSQLRSPVTFQRWATIAAAVAARAEHLKTLSRANPTQRATEALSREEVDAAILLSRTKDHRIGDDISLEQAVFLIACVGGYVGKHARTKPGVLTISRGLERIILGAEVISKLNR